MKTTLDKYLTQNKKEEKETYKYEAPEESLSKKQCKEKGYYDMTTKDIAKLIRKDLKTEFKNTIKFSVTSKAYPASINVTIKEINKEKHIMNKKTFTEVMKTNYLYAEEMYDEYLSAYNTNKFKEYHLKEETYNKINKIIDKYNYDNSDLYTDYFEKNYYSSFRVDYDVKLL